MDAPASLIPRKINTGSFLTAYTHAELVQRTRGERIVLPVCSLGTPAEKIAELGRWVLPPLYHEAMTDDLKQQLIERVRKCCPFFEGTRARAAWTGRVDVVELPRRAPIRGAKPRVFAFSVDTGMEEHGPHLPLATDTIQSYGVLERLATEFEGFVAGAPVDYGQLTWGLPFGFSIDVTAPLITQYVTGYANAVMDWLAPEALYIVDVHGSIVHRNAIQAGLQASRCRRWAFRWLHDSLTAFAADRGDLHAGGVETAIVSAIHPELVDKRWWPERVEELAAEQLPVKTVIEASSDLGKLIRLVEGQRCNGIIGDIRNAVDGPALLERMRDVAREDVRGLMG